MKSMVSKESFETCDSISEESLRASASEYDFKYGSKH